MELRTNLMFKGENTGQIPKLERLQKMTVTASSHSSEDNSEEISNSRCHQGEKVMKGHPDVREPF